MQRLERTERTMVRWMCGVTLKARVATVELNGRLGIDCIAEVVRRGRLRWFGHVERKDMADWVFACRSFPVGGVQPKGRPRKTWNECVNSDIAELGLKREWAKDRCKWRGLVCGGRPTRASTETGHASLNSASNRRAQAPRDVKR